jgi:tetratricopeptide (TPR) repeat protein
MRRTAPRVCAASIMLLVMAMATAAPPEHWEAGRLAFANGDYASALEAFAAARDAGLDGPAVHYNIAVSQYKLGQYRQAAQTFSLLADRFPAMRGLAEYNLGLVSYRLGARADARRHFLRAHELSSDDPKIRVLASQRLRELGPEVRTASRWRGALGMRAGHDDNVTLRDEAGLPAGTTTESPMIDFFAVIQGPWDRRSGIRFDGSIYTIKYFDASDFDQSEVRGAVFYDWRPGDWRFQAGVHASAGTLGGDSFDRKAGVHARAVRYLGRNTAIDLRYTYDDVSDADALFAGIEGSRQQLDLRYIWHTDWHRVQLRYWLETNDRADPAVSPDRNRLGLDYAYRPGKGLGYEAGIDLRNSDYGDLDTPRDEDLLTLWGAVTYKFATDWTVLLEYRVADNDSTDETYSYDRTQVTLGFLKTF